MLKLSRVTQFQYTVTCGLNIGRFLFLIRITKDASQAD